MRQLFTAAIFTLVLALIAVVLLSQAGLESSEALAAKAGRVYVIDQNHLGQPSQIIGDKLAQGEKIMRPPKLEVEASSEKPKSLAPKPTRTANQAVQQFRPREVIGRTSNPRVAFDQRRLDLNRVEQDFKIDFIERALETPPPEF